MLKKLTEEQKTLILETAISEFGDKGLEKATISSIAKRSGVSVGVIYKYYDNKEDLFQACLNRSLQFLQSVLDEAASGSSSLMDTCEELIRACIRFAADHSSYIKMYNAITVREGSDYLAEYAKKIETISSGTYEKVIREAQDRGEIRNDADPAALAFFFDNLLMMLHFSYGCDYYRDRMKIYCHGSEGRETDEWIVKEMLKFIQHGFGIKS